MTRTRYAVDGNLLAVQIIQQYFGDRASVAIATDVDTVDRLPFIVVDAAQGQDIANGPAGIAWQWAVNLAIIDETVGGCADISDELHEFLDSIQDAWDQRGTIAGIGAINSVEVTSIPTKSATSATPAGNMTQFDGSFNMIVRNA